MAAITTRSTALIMVMAITPLITEDIIQTPTMLILCPADIPLVAITEAAVLLDRLMYGLQPQEPLRQLPEELEAVQLPPGAVRTELLP